MIARQTDRKKKENPDEVTGKKKRKRKLIKKDFK